MQISYLHSSGDQASNVVQDLAGNDLAGFSNRQVTIDTTSRPYITLESNPSASGAVHGYLNLGDTVDLVFDFSENVTFTGQLGVGLNIGGALKSANYLSGNGTDTLTFRYTISSGDTDEQGISIKADPFTGSVKNASGVDADLWFDSVAVDYVDALSNSHAYLVDTTPPVIGNTPASNSPIHANTSVALSPLSFSDSGGSDKTLNLSMVLTNLTSTGLTDLDATTPGIQLSDTGDGLAARLANARFTATSSAANAKIAFTLTDPAGNASTYTYDFGTVL
jgi:hypothetical protein